jgi:hypothetical protein
MLSRRVHAAVLFLPFSSMRRLVDQLRFGPFAAAYYCALVDDEFKSALESYFERELWPQLDGTPDEIEGTIIARYDKDSFCHPECLVRNIFRIDAVIVDSTGASELDSDIVYDSDSKSFSARTGHDHFFYAWTPSRKQQREAEWGAINRLADDFLRGSGAGLACPICGGEVWGINEPNCFRLRCTAGGCFRIRRNGFQGKFVSGSSSLKHPLERVPRRR